MNCGSSRAMAVPVLSPGLHRYSHEVICFFWKCNTFKFKFMFIFFSNSILTLQNPVSMTFPTTKGWVSLIFEYLNAYLSDNPMTFDVIKIIGHVSPVRVKVAPYYIIH